MLGGLGFRALGFRGLGFRALRWRVWGPGLLDHQGPRRASLVYGRFSGPC